MISVTSEALFGSAARRDGDRLSDVDYLIVGDDIPVLRRRKEWLQSQGFSVSDFTWTRLERMCAKQTLFSLHLKLESKLIFDASGRLRELLSSCTAKSNYSPELRDSLKLFRPLESVPSCFAAIGWAMDILAVAFRNSAILSLAENGDYLFSMKSILEKLVEAGRITREQSTRLQQLRAYKAAYRSGKRVNVGTEDLREMVRTVSDALSFDLPCEIVMTLPQYSTHGTTNSTDAYSRMRVMEAELISMPQSALRTKDDQRLHEKLLRRVRNPHATCGASCTKRQISMSN